MEIREQLKFRLRRGLGILGIEEKIQEQQTRTHSNIEKLSHDIEHMILESKEQNNKIKAVLDFIIQENQDSITSYCQKINRLLETLLQENVEIHNLEVKGLLISLLNDKKIDEHITLEKIKTIINLILADKANKSEDYNHQLQVLLQEKEIQILQEIINKSTPGSILSCCINRLNILAPIEQLKMYNHCLHPHPEQKFNYFVETAQSDWLCSHLNPGETALDIGAAFGIITLALSQKAGSQGQVYAFEPSRNTRKFLTQILALNNIQNVTVAPLAISDELGTAEFIEYTADNELSWAVEGSTLAAETINPSLKHLCYQVDITTIDEYVAITGIQPKVIKIDIEGFELYALQGGRKTLETFLPYLCIDIHADVKTGKSALLGVEPYLLELGYNLQMQGHALYCIPKRTI